MKEGTGRLRRCWLQHTSRDVKAVEALESGLQGWVGWSVQPAASCQPPSSHTAWIVVVVVMVAVVRVCKLQAGFSLRLLAVCCVRFGAARRALLKEI